MMANNHLFRPLVAILSPRAMVVGGRLHRANGSAWVRLAERTRDSLSRQVRYDFIDSGRGWESAVDHYDAILIQRNAVGGHDVPSLVSKCKELGKPLILEIDDDLIEKSKELTDEYGDSGSSIEALARNSDLLIVSTDILKDRYSIFNPNILVEHNYISGRLWLSPLDNKGVMPKGIARRSDTEVRAIYMGSITHGRDLDLLKEPCERVRQILPDFRLFVVGVTRGSASWYERIPIPESKQNYPGFVEWLRPILSTMDFAVAPLEDTFFNAAKSDLKFIEYAAAGLACIASSVVPYSRAITHGETGLLAPNTSDAWINQLLFAAKNTSTMADIARKAQSLVLNDRLIHDREAVLDEVILDALRRKGGVLRSCSASWEKRRRKKIILHIGGGKTGSSFLQYCFAAHANELKNVGVCYPELSSIRAARQGKVSSGNSAPLASWLTNQSDEDFGHIQLMLESLALDSKGDFILLSAEQMQSFVPSRLLKLYDFISSIGCDLHIVYFIRSVAGRLYSSYSQRVKRHLETLDFKEYIKDGAYPCARIARRLADTLPGDAYSICNYDSVKDNLYRYFAEKFLPSGAMDIDIKDALVNRSLSMYEIEFMRCMNQYLNSDRECMLIGHAIMESNSDYNRIIVTPEEKEKMEQLFAADIGYLNSVLPANEQVSVVSEHEIVGERDDGELSNRERAFASALASVLKKVQV